MTEDIGGHIRESRETLRKEDSAYSLRQVAERVGLEPSYLSKIERGIEQPSEATVVALAKELKLDADVLLAMAGKVSSRLQAIICKKPKVFGELIEALENEPENAILRIVREVRDGKW